MKTAVLSMALVAAACAAPVPAPPPEPPRAAPIPSTPVVANAGFEMPVPRGLACPPRWACSVHADGSSFRFSVDDSTAVEGRHSLLIERVGKEPWAVAAQAFRAPPLRGQRIRFSIAVRTQGVDGPGAGPWFLVNGDSEVLDHQIRWVRGTQDWQRHTIELVLSDKAETFSVGATLEGGGRAWFDDARLEVLGPASR